MGINFPASPTLNQKHPQPAVAGVPVYTWDGEKWTTLGGSIAAYAPPADAVPLMNATPGLVGTATEYAREDHVHPTDTSLASYQAIACSGMQINGSMDVSQEKGTTSSGAQGYIMDGWGLWLVTTAVLSAAQTPSSFFPGFTSGLVVGVPTAQPALGANDFCVITQSIEGCRTARLAWGTANAQPITIAFWSGHWVAGTYTIAIRNSAGNRAYTTAYTQNVGNAPEYKVITIPGDTSGTWLTNNNTGMMVAFSMGAGTAYTAPSNNAWLNGDYNTGIGQRNALGSTIDGFAITGVVVLPGAQTPTAAQSANIMRPYDQELATCRRYWQSFTVILSMTNYVQSISFAPMRAVPTLLIYPQNGTGGAYSYASYGPGNFAYQTSTHSELAVATLNLNARL